MLIRPFKNTDYETIASWWQQHEEIPPHAGMMCEDGTFVVELDGEPVMSQTVLCTQSKLLCIFEFFCKSPNAKHLIGKEVGHDLWQHCFAWAKSKGYKYAITYSKEERLSKRLETFGMIRSLSGLQSFYKEL